MSTVYSSYQLYCNTESAWIYTPYQTNVPTTCPNNNSHTIDTNSISIVTSENVYIGTSQWQSQSSLTTSTSTNSTLANKISFTTSVLPIGNYKVSYYYELNTSGTLPTALCKVVINTTTYHTFSGLVITRQPISGFFILNISSPTTQVINLQFSLSSGTGSPTLVIRNAYIELNKVS
jgi:hypothetical protein